MKEYVKKDVLIYYGVTLKSVFVTEKNIDNLHGNTKIVVQGAFANGEIGLIYKRISDIRKGMKYLYQKQSELNGLREKMIERK